MEDIGSFWNFQENVDDLKQKLELTTYELEITRKETNEEIKKNTDYIQKLLQLLQTARKERDEAKTQLNKLKQIMAFNNKPNNVIDHIIPTTTTTTTAFTATPFSPDSPLLTTHFPTKANSSATESSSFSLETHNNNNSNSNNFSNHNQSHVSSPAASSPDSCNIVFSSSATNTNTAAAVTATIGMNQTTVKPAAKVVDHESLIIADLAKGRPLPQKGKLLQAVLGAGPLLSTLMVAGSLPQWRNPPGVLTHQIPPVNLKGCGGVINQSPGCNKLYYNYTSQPCNVPQQSSYDGTISGLISDNKQIVGHDVSTTSGNSSMLYDGHNSYNGPFGHYPNSLFDFGNGSSGSCYMGGRMMVNSGVSFDCHQIPKRQRII